MTVLAANVSGGRQNKAHQREINVAPANAGSVFYVGAYLCREAATGVVIPGADTAGLVPLGVVVEAMFPDDPDTSLNAHLDNTDGADGTITVSNGLDVHARVVRYDQVGEYSFAVESGTPKVGGNAYLFDDNTVDTVANTAGIIAGWFTRPAPNGGWFVDISKRGIDAGSAGASVEGVAAGYKVARGETALDGGNPTAVATGLATVVSFTATLKGTAAPGVGTSILTADISGATVNVYAWKVTGAGDTTLIASTGTESFYWTAVGT